MSTSMSSASRNESYLQDQIRALQVQGDYYARKVEIEKRRSDELDHQLKKLREQIQNLRREKVQQQQIHEKLDRELHTKQLDVAKTTQLTQSTY
ncbi:hypothetical protein DYB28_013013, partial [Aphanomyces astaci]